MTGLLDVLKETALDTGFLDSFQTSASREALPPPVRDQRLLLCLYGLGTNAGLKRVAAGSSDVSYVNTRMVQSVLRNPDMVARLSPEDYRGLSPLIYLHINPYGRFEVDLDKRINFEPMAA